MDILKDLNENQKEAASHIDGAMLILAGAGSGKTKTVTTRLAYLIANGIVPSSTLTLTFTNKAANEMRNRAFSILHSMNLSYVASPLLCTFHKFGLLFLKFHIGELGRKNNFIIIDTDDKKKIIKSFESSLSTAVLSSEISKYKNALLSCDDILSNSTLVGIDDDKHSFYEKTAEIYKKYCDYTAQNNLVDFDDLLILPYRILDKNRDLCEHISNKFQYITIDEYQDTNDIQFKLLKKLCLAHQNLVVVGDDDQSIYGWRGARIENILNFKNEFDNVKLIKLTKNYRSTDEILKAANSLISHNRNRLGKDLSSVNGKGKEIELINSIDEKFEANKISSMIQELIDSGTKPKDIAVLYRVNALSRSIEEGLNRARIPYKMVGGVKFYERMEIKDAISYLRLILNHNDDFSLRRIINRPKRGIGKIAMDKIELFAVKNNVSLFEAMTSVDLNKKSNEALSELSQKIRELGIKDGIYNLIDELESAFGLKKYFESTPEGDDRVANIDEFYAMLKDEALNNENFDLDDFLNELSLQSDQDTISDEAISIMSVHASKGLEFENLFVIGLEEGFFPLIGDDKDMEEERRLAYVAITRAKRNLTLCYADSRLYYGKREKLEKSRFLSEAGVCDGCIIIEEKGEYKKGDIVKHKLFGIGRVLLATKAGKEQKLNINFGGINRQIMSSFVERVV